MADSERPSPFTAPGSSAWKIPLRRVRDQFAEAAKNLPPLRHVAVQGHPPIDLPYLIQEEIAGDFEGHEVNCSCSWSIALDMGEWGELQAGYLYGPGDEMGRFRRLADLARNSLPVGTIEEEMESWKPRSVTPDGRCHRRDISVHDISGSWTFFVYRQLERHLPQYVVSDELWLHRGGDGEGEELLVDASPNEELPSTDPTPAQRLLVSRLEVDVFTASLAVMDTILEIGLDLKSPPQRPRRRAHRIPFSRVGVDPAHPVEERPSSPSKLNRKRSTERGEARTKLIPALTKHHEYANGGCLNLEPIGNNGLAKMVGVSPSTASAFFNDKFGGHTKYRILCRDASTLTTALKLLNNEFTPDILLGAASSDVAASEKEDTEAE
jgi:hypothetical protein